MRPSPSSPTSTTSNPSPSCRRQASQGSREALWTRLEAASFLTRDEKRAAAGYDAAEPDAEPEAKFDPNQPRDDHGRWTDDDGGGGSSDNQFRLPAGLPVHLAQGRGGRGRFGRQQPPPQPGPNPPIPPGTTIRNQALAGGKHDKTKIPFDKNGYADFSSVATHTVKVPHTGTKADISAANRAAGFKETPPGMTWHHHHFHNATGANRYSSSDRTHRLTRNRKPAWPQITRKRSTMVTMRDAFPPTNAAAVDRLQRQLGLQLPAAYRAFLLRYNGGAPDRKEFFVASRPQNPIEHIHYFFGIDVPEPTLELSSAINFYEGGIPREILPIASDGTGSYLCLDLRNSANRVAFWDHRHFWGTGEWREQDLYQVAPSFEVFLTMLRPATI